MSKQCSLTLPPIMNTRRDLSKNKEALCKRVIELVTVKGLNHQSTANKLYISVEEVNEILFSTARKLINDGHRNGFIIQDIARQYKLDEETFTTELVKDAVCRNALEKVDSLILQRERLTRYLEYASQHFGDIKSDPLTRYHYCL